jgi:dipeptidyl aminopeptidase/acylaminoacyl peptidase
MVAMRWRGLVSVVITAAACLTLVSSATAAFPGANGKIFYSHYDAAQDAEDIWSINPDGSGLTNLTNSPESESLQQASPDGIHLAYTTPYTDGVWVMNTDGTGKTQLFSAPDDNEVLGNATYSPDGKRLALTTGRVFDDVGLPYKLTVIDASDGSVETVFNLCCLGYYPAPNHLVDYAWSPDGSRLAVVATECTGYPNYQCFDYTMFIVMSDGSGATEIPTEVAPNSILWPPGQKWVLQASDDNVYTMNVDGSGLAEILDGAAPKDWSPDASTLSVIKGSDIWTVKPNGSELFQVTHDGSRYSAQWSPDGTRLLSTRTPPCPTSPCSQTLTTVKADGTDARVVISYSYSSVGYPRPINGFSWQSIPVNAYPRPKSATPTYLPMVVSYGPCGSATKVHATPLSFGSCPAQQASSQLTVGTPDANSRQPNGGGSVRLKAVLDETATPADESDLSIAVNAEDVRKKSDLTDYAGELRLSAVVRATDKRNSPSPTPSGLGAATLKDVTFGPSVPCTTTSDTAVGSTCAVSTTVNTLIPGLIVGVARTIWELGQVNLYDGGPDSDGDTAADNTPFMRQGLFAP